MILKQSSPFSVTKNAGRERPAFWYRPYVNAGESTRNR